MSIPSRRAREARRAKKFVKSIKEENPRAAVTEVDPKDRGTLAQIEMFSPDDHTVAEVMVYVDNDPDLAAAVLEAERNGKNRSSLVATLGALIDG